MVYVKISHCSNFDLNVSTLGEIHQHVSGTLGEEERKYTPRVTRCEALGIKNMKSS